jgi:hypothetical protein
MTNRLKLFVILALLFAGRVDDLRGQSNYQMADDRSFIIQGSSNIRDWAESADDADGIASVSRADNTHFDINEVRILVRADGIKSIGVEGTAMNKKTYQTLKSDRYPVITFMITSPIRSIQADGKKRLIEVTGTLIILGVSRVVQLHPFISADSRGTINVEGEIFLKMSDFNIEVPVTLFGLLHVKDDIAVHFKVSLIPDTRQGFP